MHWFLVYIWFYFKFIPEYMKTHQLVPAWRQPFVSTPLSNESVVQGLSFPSEFN